MIYEPTAGESINKACRQLAAMVKASESGESATAEFNGITVVATPGMSSAYIERMWRLVKRQREAWLATDEGQAAEQQAEVARQRTQEAEREGVVSFDVADTDSWREWLESIQGDAYGAARLRFAARWARLMDEKLSEGMELEDVAEATSHDADVEGITGFMYGGAVSILASCWRHGEALRKWHNLATQIRDEGIKANQSGGVLNPALLSISAAVAGQPG